MNRAKDIKFILAVLAAAFIMQGCDWVRGGLGLPTSEDLARMKDEIAAREQQMVLQQQREAFVQDSIAKAAALEQKVEPVAGYHVIIGSFKDYRNAEALMAFVKKQGYNPVQIELKNGYMMVSLGQMETLSAAVKLMEKIEQNEECPYDVWVYSSRQKLHKEN